MKKFIEWLRSIFPSKHIEIENDSQIEKKPKESINYTQIIDILNHYPKDEE